MVISFKQYIIEKVTAKPPFTDLPIKEIGNNDHATFKAEGELKVGDQTYSFNAGFLELSKRDNVWRAMKLHVDEKYRDKGLAFALFYAAWKKLGPYQTSRVFSPSGKKQMKGLVKRGWATSTNDDDYTIDFS